MKAYVFHLVFHFLHPSHSISLITIRKLSLNWKRAFLDDIFYFGSQCITVQQCEISLAVNDVSYHQSPHVTPRFPIKTLHLHVWTHIFPWFIRFSTIFRSNSHSFFCTSDWILKGLYRNYIWKKLQKGNEIF